MKQILTIKEFLAAIKSGKIGVDKRLLKPRKLDLGRASNYLRNGLPTVWVTKKKPQDYVPAKIIYGFTEIKVRKEVCYLTKEGASAFGDIVKLLGPGNDHLWVDLESTTVLPVHEAIKLPIGRAVSMRTLISTERCRWWVSLYKSLPWGQNYVESLKYLHSRIWEWERIKFKYK